MQKKQRNAIIVVGLLAIALFFLGNNLGLSSFTSGDIAPITASQNNLTLTLNQRAFLASEPIRGILDGTQEAVQCSIPYRTPSKIIEGQHSVIFKLNDVLIAEYPFGVGNQIAEPVISNPPPIPPLTRIASRNFQTGQIDSCGRSVLSWEGIDFSRQVPQSLKEIGGQFEFKVFTKNIATEEQTLQVLSNVYIEPLKCSDDSLVTYQRIFKQGTTIKLNPDNANQVGLGIPNPVLCHTAPIAKQRSDNNQTFDHSVLELDLLRNGSEVTVPTGEQWLFFYRGLPNVSGVLTCQDRNGVWDATNNQCVLPPTLIYLCNGIQQTNQECATQPTYPCANPNATLIILSGNNCQTGTCECQINFSPMDTEIECPSGAEIKVNPDGSKTCRYPPTPTCEKGSLQNGQCVQDLFPIVGEAGNAFPILIVVLVLIIGVAIWFYTKKS